MKKTGVVNGLHALGQLTHRVADAVVVSRGVVHGAGAVARWSAQRLGKALAANQLHRKEQAIALQHQLVQANDVVVTNVGERPELPLETVERVGAHAANGLDRHRGGTGLGGLGFEHLSDRASTQTTQDRVSPEPGRDDVVVLFAQPNVVENVGFGAGAGHHSSTLALVVRTLLRWLQRRQVLRCARFARLRRAGKSLTAQTVPRGRLSSVRTGCSG